MNKKSKRSIQMAVIGSGEGGGRIADAFAKLGYRAGAINTAGVDLEGLKAIPITNRLHIKIDILVLIERTVIARRTRQGLNCRARR